MSLRLEIFIVLFSIFFIFLLIKLVKNENISVKYALVWILPLFIFLFSSFFPNFIVLISNFFGFNTMVSFIFCVLFAFLLLLCLVLTIIVTGLRERQRILIQEVSLLKSQK